MVQQVSARSIRTFIVILTGQSISLFGSRLTSFALGMWIFLETGSVMQLALIFIFSAVPGIVTAPFAGTLVDRWDRRKAMIFSDSGAALRTLAIAALLYTNNLEMWHIYVATAFNSVFETFQRPAFSASITLLVPKRHLTRASGMVDTTHAISDVLAPLTAGILLMIFQLWGILMIDFATFLFALLTLLIIRIPRPEATMEGKTGKGSFLQETFYGWIYVRTRPGLFALLVFFANINFSLAFSTILITPLVLSFASPAVLGSVESVGSIGMLMGGFVLSAWGGPQRRIKGILVFSTLLGAAMVLTGLRPHVLVIAAGDFILTFCIPIVSGCSQAIWQTKVAPDVQGRVFSIRVMVSLSTRPFSYFLAGILADRIFEPLMAVDGPLSSIMETIIGIGSGRGIGLMLIIVGILTMITVIISSLYPRLRLVEDELPDMVAEKLSD